MIHRHADGLAEEIAAVITDAPIGVDERIIGRDVHLDFDLLDGPVGRGLPPERGGKQTASPGARPAGRSDSAVPTRRGMKGIVLRQGFRRFFRRYPD